MLKAGLPTNNLVVVIPCPLLSWGEGVFGGSCDLIVSNILSPSLSPLDFVGTTVSSVLRPGGDVSGWGVLPCPVAHTQGP